MSQYALMLARQCQLVQHDLSLGQTWVPPNASAHIQIRSGFRFQEKWSAQVTADTVLRLSRYLGTTPEFWLNLQKTFELSIAELEAGESIEKRIKPRSEAA